MMDACFAQDWQRGIKGDPSIWELADQVMAKRAHEKKEVEKSESFGMVMFRDGGNADSTY